MQLDAVTAELRPRSDWEAVDLGFAMVRRDFWRCLIVWWMGMLAPTLLFGYLLWNLPALFIVIFWWIRPMGSRMVLYQISRRLFGEQPSWKSIWKELPKACTRRFFYRFIWARFSPWLPVTLAVEDLEGLRGKAYVQRCRQVVRRGESTMMWIFFISELAIGWIALGVYMLIFAFIPEGQNGAFEEAFLSWDPNHPHEIPLLILRSISACVVVGISLTDLFLTGAGFGIYTNNRTWLEGWDVELAFKRIAQRLAKLAIIAGAFWIAFPYAHAQNEKTPTQVIEQVKADKDFIVHTVIDKIPKQAATPDWSIPSWFGTLIDVILIVALMALVALIGWLIWKYAGRPSRGISNSPVIKPLPRIVMGMEVAPDTLPADVPTAAWQLWQQGKHQEAIALLYRGSISRVIEIGHLEIQESDTEGDCMRRVEQAGANAHPDYFRRLTRLWINLAYASLHPADADVQQLCQQWPFAERRAA